MQVDKESLRKIAHLARLKLDEKDEDAMVESLTKILSWVEQLEEVDTDGIQPLTTMSKEKNVVREDCPKNTLKRDDALKNAPDHDGEHVKVPKVMD